MQCSYQCTGPLDMTPKHWTGKINFLTTSIPYEVEVTARGSTFHILFGHHKYGNYVCIPNWGIGTEISSLEDSFWNLEHLSNSYPHLSMVDAISITNALVALSHYFEV